MRPSQLPSSDVPTDDEVLLAVEALRNAADVIGRRLLAPPPAPPSAGPPGERLLSLQQVAQRLGDVSLRTVRRLVDTGELSSQLVLRRRMVRQADLDAYIESGS